MSDCSYCGQLANTVDHVPPISNRTGFIPSEMFCLSACQECNSLLSNAPIFNETDRRIFIRQRLVQRYKTVLSCKLAYTDLVEYGPTLRSKFKRTINQREHLKTRLSYNEPFARLPYYADSRM